MGLHPQLAQKHVDEASELVKAVYEARREDGIESRRIYERFYDSLALFSSGSVALSVTYLGYLKTLPSQPSGKYFLLASWISLFICLATSLFWRFLHAHYFHHAVERNYSDAQKRHREAEADRIPFVNVVNATRGELHEFQTRLREVAQEHEKDASWHFTRERIYSLMWLWTGRIAQVSFLFGIALLLLFAIKNA